MYSIEEKNYGYKLEFGDFIKEDEMQKWVAESKQKLEKASGKFGVLIDMRTLKPLSSEAQVQMEKGQKEYKQKGMERSAVILNSAVVTMQFKRIGKQTGIYQWERYIDASETSNWENIAIDWISKGVDPDQ